MKKHILIFVFFLSAICAQEISVINELKLIEQGETDKARLKLEQLKESNPGSTSVMFLDAVLTEDGTLAFQKYLDIYNKYPKSMYADASVFRIYSYYYAIGSYSTARSYLEKLKTEYPYSPYLKALSLEPLPDEDLIADQKQPEVIKDPEEKNKVPVVVNKEKKFYSIQIGAFLTKENAEKQKKKYKDSGYYSEIIQKEIGGSLFNIVLVGKFDTITEAQTINQNLSKEFHISGKVIEVK